MTEDNTLPPDQWEWDDEVVDEAIVKLVKLIQSGHEFNNGMFVGGLTGGDLARLRAEKKQNEKEVKEKKDREIQANVVYTETGEIGASTHIANLVAGLINSNIVDVVSKEAAKIEDRLCKVITAQREEMEAAVIRSITDLLGKAKHNIVLDGDSSKVGQSKGLNDDASIPKVPNEGTRLPGEETLSLEEDIARQLQADEALNKVINDVQMSSIPDEVSRS